VRSDEISILDGSTFVVSDRHGDIEASPDQVQGLFHRDTRFLSRWRLSVNGGTPDVLSVEHGAYFAAQFFLYPPTGTIYENPYLSVIRKRKVGEGFHEDVTVLKRFRVELPGHDEWSTCIDVIPVTDPDGPSARVKYGHDADEARPNMPLSLGDWLARAPQLESDLDELEHVYRQSLVDLAALRFYSILFPGESLPAAGLPWFMTIFGRDSLIVSYQSLPFTPELARTALRVLAARQGTAVDPFRDEEPGKVLHEIRFGELTHFGERPHSPYFGAADATPLFLVVLDEYERWTGDRALVQALEPNARAALEWINAHGDRDGDGYVEYARRNEETGLENQCWKDSWNSIVWNDGTLAKLPRATCEIQGYVYDAKRRSARLAREIWGDEELARRLECQAGELKRRFNADFWLPERGFFALALDGDKRPVDTLTSNAGQLLWSGIVDEDKAEAVAGRLMSPSFFSGWGVRTMAEGEGPYNPIEYHNGTRLAARQRPHRGRPRALRLPGGAGPHRDGVDRGGHVLRLPPPRGLRRVRARADALSRRVPHRLQPPGVGDRSAAPRPARTARTRARRRRPPSRAGPATGGRAHLPQRDPRAVGPHRRRRRSVLTRSWRSVAESTPVRASSGEAKSPIPGAMDGAFCAQCGSPCGQDDRFCRSCGASVHSGEEAVPNTAGSTRPRKRLLLVATLLILGAALSGGGFVAYSQVTAEHAREVTERAERAAARAEQRKRVRLTRAFDAEMEMRDEFFTAERRYLAALDAANRKARGHRRGEAAYEAETKITEEYADEFDACVRYVAVESTQPIPMPRRSLASRLRPSRSALRLLTGRSSMRAWPVARRRGSSNRFTRSFSPPSRRSRPMPSTTPTCSTRR
jgi:hypothetical protein